MHTCLNYFGCWNGVVRSFVYCHHLLRLKILPGIVVFSAQYNPPCLHHTYLYHCCMYYRDPTGCCCCFCGGDSIHSFVFPASSLYIATVPFPFPFLFPCSWFPEDGFIPSTYSTSMSPCFSVVGRSSLSESSQVWSLLPPPFFTSVVSYFYCSGIATLAFCFTLSIIINIWWREIIVNDRERNTFAGVLGWWTDRSLFCSSRLDFLFFTSSEFQSCTSSREGSRNVTDFLISEKQTLRES